MVENKKYIEAKNKILNRFKDSEILCVMELKDGLLFSIKPKKINDYVLDAFFKVNNHGEIKEYSPVMNPDEFKYAMKNIVYSKKRR